MTNAILQRPRGAANRFRQRLALRGQLAKRSDDQDWKLFLLSFAAFFTCIYTLIV